MHSESEQGRSLLEIILVIAVVIILTMGAIVGYRQIIAQHLATELTEDILLQADSKNGLNYKNKQIYDSGIGDKTRHGLDMNTDTRGEHTFTITVRSISSDICPYLNKQDWKSTKQIQIDGKVYLPKEIVCPTTNNFDLTAVFAKSKTSSQSSIRTCGHCFDCETCDEDTNTCQSTCGSGKTCKEDGCKTSCPEGKYDNNGCEDCPSGTNCESCPSKTPIWNGSSCVCTNDSSCGNGYACNSGDCEECYTDTVCGGCPASTPVWDGSNCVNCPIGATCTSGEIICIDGQYLSGLECKECPENAKKCKNSQIICKDGFKLSGESCILDCAEDGPCEGCQTANSMLPNWDSTKEKCVCSENPNSCGTLICDTETGKCTCNPEADTCEEGTYCNPNTKQCDENTCSTIPNTTPVANANQVGETDCYCKEGYTLNSEKTACVTPLVQCGDVTCNIDEYCATYLDINEEPLEKYPVCLKCPDGGTQSQGGHTCCKNNLKWLNPFQVEYLSTYYDSPFKELGTGYWDSDASECGCPNFSGYSQNTHFKDYQMCCRNNKISQSFGFCDPSIEKCTDEDAGWLDASECGCPEPGTNINGTCCYNGFTYGQDYYTGNYGYNTEDSSCCPSGHRTFTYTQDNGKGCCIEKTETYCPDFVNNPDTYESDKNDHCTPIACCQTISNIIQYDPLIKMDQFSYKNGKLSYPGNLDLSNSFTQDNNNVLSCDFTVTGELIPPRTYTRYPFTVNNLTVGNENVDYGLNASELTHLKVNGNLTATGKVAGIILGYDNCNYPFSVTGDVIATGGTYGFFKHTGQCLTNQITIGGTLKATGGVYGVYDNTSSPNCGNGVDTGCHVNSVNRIEGTGGCYGVYLNSGDWGKNGATIKGIAMNDSCPNGSYGVFINMIKSSRYIEGTSLTGTGVYIYGETCNTHLGDYPSGISSIIGNGKITGVDIYGLGSEECGRLWAGIQGTGSVGVKAQYVKVNNIKSYGSKFDFSNVNTVYACHAQSSSDSCPELCTCNKPCMLDGNNYNRTVTCHQGPN